MLEETAYRRNLADIGRRGQKVPSSFCLGEENPLGECKQSDMEAVIARIKSERARRGVQVTSEEIEAKKVATIKELEKMCLKEQLIQNMQSIEERIEARRKRREEAVLEHQQRLQEQHLNGNACDRNEKEETAFKVKLDFESNEGDFTGGTHAGHFL